MATNSYTIRDDRYTVVVGWEHELETFYAFVFDSEQSDGEPFFAAGRMPREIVTLSELLEVVSPYASVDAATTTALRHDATRLG